MISCPACSEAPLRPDRRESWSCRCTRLVLEPLLGRMVLSTRLGSLLSVSFRGRVRRRSTLWPYGRWEDVPGDAETLAREAAEECRLSEQAWRVLGS